MKTSKPFACITYNTNKFLDLKLKDFLDNHLISFYAYINHKGEKEVNISTGEVKVDKDHTHLFIIPNRSIDTMDLMSAMLELDKKHPKQPLKPLCFAPSKWDDWYLYNLHDDNYLMSKFETKEFHYTNDDFHVSDKQEFEYMAYDVFHTSAYTRQMRLMEYLRSGRSMGDLCRRGAISPHQAFSYQMFDKLWRSDKNSVDN